VASKTAEEPPLRWSLVQAAREFSVPRENLRRRLGECHQQPAADGCYSTRQLTLALFGDLYAAKVRVQNEQFEKLRIENEISRGELLSRRELTHSFTAIAEAMSARIMSCTELPRLAREDILKDLSSWPLALAEAAHRQSRLARGNGKRDGDDQSES
jgi:hypothetical protein